MSCVLRSSVTDPCLMFMEKQWNLPRTFLMLSLNSIKGWQQLPKRDILKWCVMKWTHALEFLSPAYNASHDPACEQTTLRQLFICRALPSVDSYLLCSSAAAQKPVIYYCLFCQTKYLPSIPQQLTITVRSSRVHRWPIFWDNTDFWGRVGPHDLIVVENVGGVTESSHRNGIYCITQNMKVTTRQNKS